MIKRLLLFAAVGIALSYASDSDTYNERDLTDKVAVITGAARGIGYCIVESFLEAGCKFIIMLDKEEELGKQVSEEFNDKYGANRTVFIGCHINDDFDEISEYIINNYSIDILVHNAGILNETNPKETMNTNAVGPLQWSMKFYDIMRQDYGGKGGTIMFVSSIAGYVQIPFFPYYQASKWALMGFTKGKGHECNYKRTGVRIISICPGFTYTKMTEQQMVTDDQLELFNKFIAVQPWQEADCVGTASVQVFQNADSGTSWDSIGCADPTESPDKEILTCDYLESL